MHTEERKNGMPDAEQLQCPECGGFRVQTVPAEHTFAYGVGDKAEQITATLSFRHCQDCRLRFLDDEGETAMHEAVCRHLDVMTPAEIRQVRERYALSRQEFSQLTKLGEATIARWERGALIQNAANDHLLYLLTFPENVAQLQRKSGEEEIGSAAELQGFVESATGEDIDEVIQQGGVVRYWFYVGSL